MILILRFFVGWATDPEICSYTDNADVCLRRGRVVILWFPYA